MLEVAGAPHGWLLFASQRVWSLFPKHASLLSLSCKREGGKETDGKRPLILRVSTFTFILLAEAFSLQLLLYICQRLSVLLREKSSKSFHASMKRLNAFFPPHNLIYISFFYSNQQFLRKRWVICKFWVVSSQIWVKLWTNPNVGLKKWKLSFYHF